MPELRAAVEASAKNLRVIMKDGKIYKNTLID
jgi:hypothetical protein